MASGIRLKLVWLLFVAASVVSLAVQLAQQHFSYTASKHPLASAAPQQCTETQSSQPRVLFVSCGGYF